MGTAFGTQNKNPIQRNVQPCDAQVTQKQTPKLAAIVLLPNYNSLQTNAQASPRARGANDAKTNSQRAGRSVCKVWGFITKQCAAELPRSSCKREVDEAANGASVTHSA